MNIVVKIAAALVGVGGILVAGVWFFQRSLVFAPDNSSVPSAADVVDGGKDLTLTTSDGLKLGAWLLPPKASADREMAVLYAPGNGGNRAGRIDIGNRLADRGFTVLLMDYRGYGGNPGSPSEDGLARDAAAAVEALAGEGFDADHTIYLGESIGTGVVARLQNSHPPAGVLLRSPFTDFVAVAGEHFPYVPVSVLLGDRFPVVEYLRDSNVPVSVVYGTADQIVPPELSASVANKTGNLHEEIVFDGKGHNDGIMFGSKIAEAVARLAEAITK